jgi:cytochrome b561
MTDRTQYGTTAKMLHWLVVALLLAQYLIGWFMPDIHRGMQPGDAMTWHISVGIVILALIVVRLAWRLTHRVAPDASLAPWQRIVSEILHWLLYVLVLLTTISGWLFASFRGWSISFFFLTPLPMLSSENLPALRAINHWHQKFEWTLLILIGLHVVAALAHLVVYRDRVMHRMLPGVSA